MPENSVQFTVDIVPPIDKFLDADLADGDANREIQTTMEGAVQIMRSAVHSYTPQAFGTLRNSIMGQVRTSSHIVEGHIVTSLPYAEPVEMGSKPHWAPLDPLILWVRRKFSGAGGAMHTQAKILAKQTRAQGVKGYRASDAKEQLIYAMAKGVQRAIAKHGTRAHQMFQKGYNERMPTVVKMFDDLRDRIIQRLKSQ